MYFFPNVWTQFLPRTQNSIHQTHAKIKETSTLYKIIINVYGLKFEDISLELTGTTLELRSSTASSDLPEEAKLIWQEFNLPKLDHRFKLPSNANIDEISAASIIAKVYRDNLMLQFDKKYPNFHFSSHKGYGTNLHKAAINKYGITPAHRKTFKGVIN